MYDLFFELKEKYGELVSNTLILEVGSVRDDVRSVRPERGDRDAGRVVPLTQDERKDQLRSAVSFGVGYSSPRSFFMDFAVRFQYLPSEYITPYWYYYMGHDGSTQLDIDVVTPEIGVQSALCNALLTLGWRF